MAASSLSNIHVQSAKNKEEKQVFIRLERASSNKVFSPSQLIASLDIYKEFNVSAIVALLGWILEFSTQIEAGWPLIWFLHLHWPEAASFKR